MNSLPKKVISFHGMTVKLTNMFIIHSNFTQHQSLKKPAQTEKSVPKKDNIKPPLSNSHHKSLSSSQFLQIHPDEKSSFDGTKKQAPDTIMSKHFGGWRSPVSAHANAN